MNYFRVASLVSLVGLLSLNACGSSPSVTAIPTVVLRAREGNSTGSVSASAQIVPVRSVQLSFPLTGVVRTVYVQAGDPVKIGQMLIGLDTAILAAKANVADADLQAAQIQYTYLARTGTDQEHLDSALADVDRAQALADSAMAALAQATLHAPFDGTVTSVEVNVAETVTPGQIVLVMGDLTEFEVETTDLSERDAPKVQVGQSAQVHVTALDNDFAGRVTEVSRIATTVGGDAVFKVTIRLDTTPPGLLWGMTADVRITVNE